MVPSMMSASDFRVALARLDIPQKRFAEMIGYRNETVSRWATGLNAVPKNVELILSLLRQHLPYTEAE